jgi:glutathione synthase/RimK-type ligase-like ATP-grasp enzyme
VIFQEYIPAGVDLRVTIVGSQVFCGAIHSQAGGYKADFRMEMDTSRIEPSSLPENVERCLLGLMKRLGLVYGAVDLRRTPSGEHVFLEVNTAGQWLFVEQATGQPIAQALAEALVAGE